MLKNIDFTLKPGQTLGLVGRVGAGKTTIIQLLLREFDQYDGEITLNGINIKKIPLKVLLSQISYVPQNNFLFSTSIGRNIAFSEADAGKMRLRQLLRRVICTMMFYKCHMAMRL